MTTLSVLRIDDRLAALTDDERSMIELRRRIIGAFHLYRADGRQAGKTCRQIVAEFAALQSISRSTLYRWWSACKAEDWLRLLDRRSNRVRASIAAALADGSSGASASRGQLAEARFREMYFTPQRRTVKLCWEMVAWESDQHPGDPQWSWPGLRSVQAWVAAMPESDKDYYRLGEREWRRLHEPKLVRDYSQYRSNQVWVADFHKMDVFCRRSDQDATIVRPLLSAFLDLRSRVLAGWCLTDRECQDTVLLAFRNGVEIYGVPQEVILDNGKPYRAVGVSGGRPGRGEDSKALLDEAYLRGVFGALNVQVHFAIPYNPDSKPIERFFSTLEMQFGALFESYCGGDNNDERFKHAWKLAQAHPKLCPTVEQLRQKLTAWLDAYHATAHGGDGLDGRSPKEAFDLFDPVPRVVCPEGLLDLLLMRLTRPVRVGRDGVRYNGIDYGAWDRRVQAMHGRRVLLRVDPQRADYVVICESDGKPIMRAINNRLALHEVDADAVAAGIREQRRARKLMKKVQDGEHLPALDDVATAAIRAKYERGEADVRARLLGTGTDDAAPQRGIAPLASDWAESARRFAAQVDPPLPPPSPLTLDDFGGASSPTVPDSFNAVDADDPPRPAVRLTLDDFASD